MRSFASTVFLLVIAAKVAFSLTPESQLTAFIDAGEYAQAIAYLETARAKDPASFAANDHDYLLGKLAADIGNLGLAASSFQRVALTNSPLKPYALKHLAELARSTGNLLLERLYLLELIEYVPDSIPTKSAFSRLARNYFETANYSESIRTLTLSDSGNSDAENIRGDRLLLAKSHLKMGQVETARQIFADLLDTIPNAAQPDDIALASVVNLDEMFGGKRGKEAPQLTEAEHFRRAGVYQFNREFVDARLHYQALIAGYPTGVNAADAVLQIGRGYAQQANYLEALKWFERVIEQYPKSAAAKDALLQAASAYARVAKPKEAVNRYELFIERFPDDERLDRAYLNIVDILRDQGEDTEALKRCEVIREVFKGKTAEAIAMFTQARIHLAREEWSTALELLDNINGLADLGGSRVPGGTTPDEISFLRAVALEKQKRFADAVPTYLSIADGRNEYYGWRSNERIKIIASTPEGNSVVSQLTDQAATGLTNGDTAVETKNARYILRLTDDVELRTTAINVLRKHARLPSQRHASSKASASLHFGDAFLDRLITFRLYEEAASELGQLPLNTPLKREATLDVFNRGNRADLVVAAVEPVWRNIPNDLPLETLSSKDLKHLYPVAYRKEIIASTAQTSVDPRLMLAIIRQESRFRASAKSNAAARGLMQFISTTSIPVAAKLGRERFRQDDLYTPSTAVSFGARYLTDLYGVFPGQTEAVVASYNGGDDNMKRWFNRARSNEPDRYVAEIVYAQSKDYVHKVMAAYRVYQFLYDENLLTRTGE